MMPVAIMIGDYNNVFMLFEGIAKRYGAKPIDRPLLELHTQANFWKEMKSSIGGEMRSETSKEVIEAFREHFEGDHSNCFEIVREGSCKGETVVNFFRVFDDGEFLSWWYNVMRNDQHGFSFGLQLAFGPDNCKEKTIRHVFDGILDEAHEAGNFYILPGNGNESSKSDDIDSTISANTTNTKKKDLFHRDEKGRVAFSLAEAERASDFISSSNLIERIKAGMCIVCVCVCCCCCIKLYLSLLSKRCLVPFL